MFHFCNRQRFKHSTDGFPKRGIKVLISNINYTRKLQFWDFPFIQLFLFVLQSSHDMHMTCLCGKKPMKHFKINFKLETSKHIAKLVEVIWRWVNDYLCWITWTPLNFWSHRCFYWKVIQMQINRKSVNSQCCHTVSVSTQ